MGQEGIRRKSKKREDILLAAERLFMEKGLNRITVEEIVMQAKVSKATFYKYYYDKKDIAEQVFINIVDAGIKDLSGLIEKGEKSGLKRDDFMTIFDMNEYDQLYQSGFIKELFNTYPDLYEKMLKTELNRVMIEYKSFMVMAQQSGIIRTDVDAETLMTYTSIIKRGLGEHLRNYSKTMDNKSIQDLNKVVNMMYLEGVLDKKH